MDPIQAGGEESAPEIGVVLKTINDETFGVHLRRDALISELKTKVKVTTQVPEDRQRLIYRGRVLEDSQRLSTYNVEDGHTIHVVARPNPPPAPTAPSQEESFQQTRRDSASVEASQMSGLSSLAESLLARSVGGAGRQARDRNSQAPESLEHIRQSMLTMLTLMSTMSTVSVDDFHDRAQLHETKESEELESKENGPTPARGQQRKFFVGQWLDVKDTVDQWLEATVLDINDGKILIHYNGWPSRWDEWIEFASPRIAPFRTRTSHVLSATSDSPAPVTVVAHAPSTGVNDMRLVLPEMVAMSKLMTARLEELSQLYTEHWAHDPNNAQFNRGGAEAVAANLPWSNAGAPPPQEIGFSAEKEARMNALASELAPLCDRFGRAVVDLAPQLQRLSPPDMNSTDAEEEEEDVSPYHFLTRALGRGRRRNLDTPASTDRAYRQIISSTARGHPHAGGGGNHLDIHIHAILTPTSGMFGGGNTGGVAANAASINNGDAQTSGRSGGPLAQMNMFRSLAELQNRRQSESLVAQASEAGSEGAAATRGGIAMRRLFHPQPRPGMRSDSASPLASALSAPLLAPESRTGTTLPPPPPHPAPAPPLAAHDDLDVVTTTRPPLPPRATSDSVVAAAVPRAPQQEQQQAPSHDASAAQAAGSAEAHSSAAADDASRNTASNASGGGGLLRSVLRRWSRTFSPQGPN